ncbi:MAG: hypothetical protein ACOCXA_01695 [Planctomycetota bacterium]
MLRAALLAFCVFSSACFQGGPEPSQQVLEQAGHWAEILRRLDADAEAITLMLSERCQEDIRPLLSRHLQQRRESARAAGWSTSSFTLLPGKALREAEQWRVFVPVHHRLQHTTQEDRVDCEVVVLRMHPITEAEQEYQLQLAATDVISRGRWLALGMPDVWGENPVPW